MKIGTYLRDGEFRLALRDDEETLIDVADAAKQFDLTVPAGRDFFAAGLDALPALRELASAARQDRSAVWRRRLQDVRLGPCVLEPQKILCVGLNYARHARESGLETPTTPILFSKFGNALSSSGSTVQLPGVAEKYDYEAELVVVVGRTMKDVDEADALDHVLGYCNGNDVSARDLQGRTSQWLLGKTLDGFMPIGPWLVTADEVPDPQQLRVRCWLNGQLRQDSTTADMIFSVADVLSYASRHMTLLPGDIVATGTPEGVILGMQEKMWMKSGDRCEVEIGNLGRLENVMMS